MSAAPPAWLWVAAGGAAAVALALDVAARRRRCAALAAFASKAALDRLAGGAAPPRAGRAVLLAAAALLATLAVHDEPVRGPAAPARTDLLVVFDCSRSMLAQDARGGRLAEAKAMLLDVLGRFPGRAGLIPFAGTAFLQCPLTTDVAAVRSFVGELSPEDFAVGGSALAEALDVAVASFDPQSRADRALLLVTDGEATTGSLAEVGRRLARARARVVILGIGSPAGAPVPARGGGFARSEGGVFVSRLAEGALEELARLAGGTYLRAGGGDAAALSALLAPPAVPPADPGGSASPPPRSRWVLAGAALALTARLALGLGPRAAAGVLLALAAVLLPGPARAALADTLVGEGVRLSRAGDQQGALGRFLAAQVEEPERAEIAYDLGNVFFRLGRFEEALRSYAAVPETAEPRLRAWTLYNMGNSAYRLGRYEQASGHYRAALRLAPGDADARFNLELAARAGADQERRPRPGSKGAGDRGGRGREDLARRRAASPPFRAVPPRPGGAPGRPAANRPEPGAEGRPGTASPDWRERLFHRLPDRSVKDAPAAYGLRAVERDW